MNSSVFYPKPNPPPPSKKALLKSSVNRDFCRLRYFRFRFRDYLRTIDFYKACGMVIEFEGEQESFQASSFQPKQGPAKTMESTHLKKAGKDEPTENAALGGPCGKIISFSYMTASGNKDPNRIQLIFEEDWDFLHEENIKKLRKENKVEENLLTDSAEAVDGEAIKETKNEAKKQVSEEVKRDYEYLVIYVHFIERLVKRLDSKGFKMVLEVTDIEGIKLAIFEDPNGLPIRFIEMSDQNLNMSKNAQWYSRIGYFTFATSDADNSVMYYENLFQTKIKKDAKTAEEEANNSKPNIRKIGAAQVAKQAFNKGPGFKLVDMEEFVIGLTTTVFYWLGNDIRSSSASLCFTEVRNEDSKLSITTHNPAKSKLVAVGFEVNNIDTMTIKLKYETKDEIKWEPLRYRMAKAGIAARFVDKINHSFLEIFSSKGEEKIIQGKGGRISKILVAPKAHGQDQKEEQEFYINMNHLNGRARYLSNGAVERFKGYGHATFFSNHHHADDNTSIRQRKVEKKFIAAAILESADSLAELPVLGNKRGGQANAKKVKTRDEQAIDLFLSREKSKSI